MEMVKSSRVILKTLVFVILIGLVQSSVCSILCSMPINYSCVENVQSADSCCGHDDAAPTADKPTPDCQARHLSFALTIGQFTGYANTDLPSVVSFKLDWFQIPEEYYVNEIDLHSYSFNELQLPPPKSGIPVLVHSLII